MIMDKKTRVLLVVIGIISILTGTYGYMTKAESPVNFSAIFIGLALIGTVYFNYKGVDQSDKKRNGDN